MKTRTRILSTGTAVPETRFTQEEAARLMGVGSAKAKRFFEHGHIKTRHLLLPKNGVQSEILREETPLELREKFLHHSTRIIRTALEQALKKARLNIKDVDYIACVTSTGFVVPGLSALVIEELGLNPGTQRVDIVGMGCNAGLNGLQSVSNWCSNNPEKIGVLVCCELCSCIYTFDDSENTALVNSLFGDGVVAAVLKNSATQEDPSHPSILHFSSHLIGNSLDLLRFDWDLEKDRYSFYVDKKTPETLAREVQKPFAGLLKKAGINESDLHHWIVHSGGAAILDAMEKTLQLPGNALRHTRSVLHDYGNVSSGSFLFSFQRLIEEKIVRPHEHGLVMTMGPGLTIEMALLQWS